ncbi:MAG: type II toxin-antitoxin system VapC family toxin [Candidatus Thiosymbion ectosymbiont of Robbea hypermnestra]|nr:type II toxin-antitoxin system VapC family toxin [Candidatus Thiosymbion ectosymbiont of Robbea hypermnestra]
MSGFILIDTDILIDAGLDVQHAIGCLKQYEQRTQLAVSIITKMELVVGCRNKNELRNIEKFLQRFEIFSVDEAISEKADELLISYRLSHGLRIPDSLIAATAIIGNCPLVSKNQRDYRFITELDLLPYP